MILPTGHHGLRRLFDETAHRHGVTRVSRIEINSLSQIQRLVQRGFGVTVLSRAALHDSPVDPPLASVRISAPAITRTVALAYEREPFADQGDPRDRRPHQGDPPGPRDLLRLAGEAALNRHGICFFYT